VDTITQPQIDAAQAFSNAVIAELQTGRGVHAETAVAATARMAGTFLFRSFGFDPGAFAPGQAVLSEAANTAGPGLIRVLAGALAELGIPLDEQKLGAGQLDANRPSLDFLATQTRLEPRFAAIRAKHGLSLTEAADAAAIATAFLIHQCARVLDPSAAFGVAVYGFIEGTKTAPGPGAR
jgi:hypothetical protein